MSKLVKVNTEESVNEWCYNSIYKQDINIEAIFDILDVYTRLLRRERQTVSIVINEQIILMAMKNVKDYHEMKRTGSWILGDDEFLESRRQSLMDKWSEVL